MNWIFRAFFLLPFLFFLGCVTPFNPEDHYKSIQLNKDTYRLTFEGAYGIQLHEIQQYLLFRAAKLAQQEQYPYFIIIESNASNSQRYVSAPTVYNFNKTSNYSGNAFYNNNFLNAMGSSNIYGRGLVTQGPTEVQNAYTISMMIKLLKTNKGHPDAMEPSLIIESIRASHKSKN